MPIILQTTSSTYRVKDDSGYEFELVTALDPETGWSASLYLGSGCMKTEQAAIDNTIKAAHEFIRIAEETLESRGSP